MRTLPLLLILLAAAPLQEGKDKDLRHVQTVRYKEFPEIVEAIAGEVQKNDKAVVVWLVDNARMLKASKHGEMLADAIQRSFKKSKTLHAVVAFAEKPQLVQKPVDDPGKAAAAIEALANGTPDDAIKNCLLNVREAAKVAAGISGMAKKYIVLFTQENGDSEDDVEATLRVLKNTNTTFIPIAPEALYSDPYWESAYSGSSYFFDMDKIKKLPFQLKGPESAVVEFPYGWPFTRVDPGYTVPAGFGYWGLGRLAAQTGGSYYLYTIDRSVWTFCQRYGCSLCAGQHKTCGAVYDETKLGLTDPDAGSRGEYATRYGKDKIYLSMRDAWEKLHKAGIFRGEPPALGQAAAPRRPERPISSAASSIYGSEWKTIKPLALKHAAEAEREAADLLAACEKPGKTADPRVVATAEALAVHLRMVGQAYKQLAAFCDEMERLRGKKPASDGFASSELETPPGEKVAGYTWDEVYLCHGGAALKDTRFLGDLKELHATFDYADKMIEKHRGTPWEILIRRAYLPIFRPYLEVKIDPKSVTTQRPRPTGKSTTSDDGGTATPGTPARPARPNAGAGTSAGSGTATGGNR